MTATPEDIPLRTTIPDVLVERLRAMIRSGELPPGSRVRQGEVATRFQVSTTPVREAFARLEREGLLVASPHRGMVVFQPTIEDLQQTYEIRIPLEALATEKAVERMTADDLGALERLLDQMRGATADADRYNELNREYHATIYRAAGRPKLEKLIADLRDASAAYLRLYATLAPGAEDTQRDHEAIFEACRARAPKRAAKAMTAHLSHTVEHVSRGLMAIDNARA